ncbi:insulin-like growth factor 2 mRNA-binding protein 2 [Trichonephila clavipes]|uniref:Insulin-like growth factor 2 mRNA-binding protein 2 n=1 Tax=Trichonephila clavipes TaxID=2585209 RepID=A0A8X6VE22_TRICX|nr:insulin-like growth factor 2 mRNA-binding protein 2 [Trichonephila clavipes]
MSANQRLFIGNLPPQINEETLRDIFFQRTGVLPQNTFLRPNFALVRLPDTLTLEKATEMLNGYEVMGSHLVAEPSSLAPNRSAVVPNPWSVYHMVPCRPKNIHSGTLKIATQEESIGLK